MPERILDSEPGVAINSRALPRDTRDDDPRVLVLGNILGFKEGRRHVENAGVAQFPNVTRKHVRQPEMWVGRFRALTQPGAAVRRAMPPLQDVALPELLARMQHDLRAREPRFEQNQRQHILQLVAKSGRASALIWSHSTPQSRSIELVGQPGVDETVEVG